MPPVESSIALRADPSARGRILDGRQVASEVRRRVGAGVAARVEAGGAKPGLAVILVGSDPASQIYVRNKNRACDEVGIASTVMTLPASIEQADLLAEVARLNADPVVHGILVQSPLSPHIDPNAVIDAIDPGKDVDGFHPFNLGRLAQRRPVLRSCTPKGIMTLLAHTGVPIRGLDAVIVGASNHVGRPMGLELLLAGCTVTTAHKFSRTTADHVRRADIVIAAAGRPGLVRGDWIKDGAVVIDVGINRLTDGRIVGDVEFDTARERAAWITPVPGGVGQMTVASLLENTLQAANLQDPPGA
ncbi:MAG: bifunctional methylenetetrahydrofolate dehydrogenase/methenyltetrahydrofolate cyclohydrolase FolD [Gammaproteobacteria bacterium]|nr:bifunctional methylenetetrahydrofolate dehydrogenase/methenyltetrahydrofolate cyclohydrolase FolD [Gammaproteobacteria bacterium]